VWRTLNKGTRDKNRPSNSQRESLYGPLRAKADTAVIRAGATIRQCQFAPDESETVAVEPRDRRARAAVIPKSKLAEPSWERRSWPLRQPNHGLRTFGSANPADLASFCQFHDL